jgi:hypothetical protein
MPPLSTLAAGTALLLLSAAISWAIAFGLLVFRERREPRRRVGLEAQFGAAASTSVRHRAQRQVDRANARLGVLVWRNDAVPSKGVRAVATDALVGAAVGAWHVLLVAIMALAWLRSDYLDAAVFATLLLIVCGAAWLAWAIVSEWRRSQKPAWQKLLTGLMYTSALAGFSFAAVWLDKHAPWWWWVAALGLMVGAAAVYSGYEMRKLRRQRVASSNNIRRRWFRPARMPLRRGRVVRRLSAH